MEDKKVLYKIPEELKFAPKSIKDSYKKWCELDEKLKNFPGNPLVYADRHGEPIFIDCNAVYTQNIKKLKKLGINDQKIFDEVIAMSKRLKKVQMEKGGYTRIYNGYITGNKSKSIVEWKKQDLLEEFGRYKNVDQVLEWVKEQGFSIQRGKLVEFFAENLDEIKDRRLRFQQQEKDFYLATGTGRIESLSYLYSEVLKLFESTKNKGYASEARAIIEQVRKEVKGDEIRLTVNGEIDLTATIQANRTINELNSKIPINMFIISLVAGKKGVNPQDIMAQLTNSFYSKWNGFNKLGDNEEQIKLPSHFIQEYDWNEIDKVHRDKDERASKMLYDKKLEYFFKREGVKYSGNVQQALNQLKVVCGEESVSEIVDVTPLNTEVEETKREKIKDKRAELKVILELRNKQLQNDGQNLNKQLG